MASFTVLAAELLDRRLVGTGVGVMNAVGYGMAALGDPVMGAGDRRHRTHERAVFVVTAAACLASALCARPARR